MHSLSDMAKALNRPTVYIHGLQTRFELPLFTGARYSDAYLAFLRTVVFLRVLNVAEETLLGLWHMEKQLLRLLHVDTTGSSTWFLDSCGQTSNSHRRLLLTNHDVGTQLPTRTVQLGLDFSEKLPELFSGKEMGEDELRAVADYLKLHARIGAVVGAEVPLLRRAIRWAAQLK